MAARYIELRKSSARGTDSMIADIMRHLHARQHLGKAAVLTDYPLVMLPVARKQWLKLARYIQKQRASTLNADKILKYTHTITRMQHMQFCDKSPLEKPNADIYFLDAKADLTLPAHCWSVYITADISLSAAQAVIEQLPPTTLLVDYTYTLPWQALNLEPKKVLEENVVDDWRKIKRFLHLYKLDITMLTYQGSRNIDVMENALDTLLGAHGSFLPLAYQFQRSLELARPLRISKEVRRQYDTLVLLAHRVQALIPGAFTQRFLESYNEDDTFFLYDRGRPQLLLSGESIELALKRHLQAGRAHLAHALMQSFGAIR